MLNISRFLSVHCRATIQAISAYLDVFQKIADAATNSKGLPNANDRDCATVFVSNLCAMYLNTLRVGATKEIGTALTRICLRHKSVETRMKTFTSTIMDSLIIPLQVRCMQ